MIRNTNFVIRRQICGDEEKHENRIEWIDADAALAEAERAALIGEAETDSAVAEISSAIETAS